MILSIYFVCQLLHIIYLSVSTQPQLKVSNLRKFTRCGCYYSAIVQAAASQVVLRLALPGVLTGTLPCLPRSSSGRAGTLSPPGYRKPVERRSFATFQCPTLPLRFCLQSTLLSSYFRFRLVDLRKLRPSRLRFIRSFSSELLRQPQVGQTVGGCQSCNINITVFDIIRNYSHGSVEYILNSCCRAYNSILCQIRTAGCKSLKAFSVLFRGTVLPTHPPAEFFLIVDGFLTFRQLNSISFVIDVRTSKLKIPAALRLAPALSLRRMGTASVQRLIPATPIRHRDIVRPLNDR